MKDAPSERNSALFGLRLGVFFGDMIGVEAEVGVVPSESRTLVFDIWNLTYRAHLVAQFRANNPATKLIPFVLAGGGAFQVVDTKGPDTIGKDTDSIIYAGVGAKYRVDNGWGLRADARVLFVPSSKDDGFTEDFELLLSIYKEFGRKTADKPIAERVDDASQRFASSTAVAARRSLRFAARATEVRSIALVAVRRRLGDFNSLRSGVDTDAAPTAAKRTESRSVDAVAASAKLAE